MRIHVYLIGAIVIIAGRAIGSATGLDIGRSSTLWHSLIFGVVVILIRQIIRRWTPRLTYASTIFETSAIFLLSWEPILVICYSAQTPSLPLCDDLYRSLDLLLGFDGAAVIEWMSHYPALCWFMGIAYNMFFPSMFIVMLFGGWFGSAYKIAERAAISIIFAFLITAGLSSLFPAYGYGAYITPDLIRTVAIGATPIAQLDALRDGSMRILDSSEGGGIITFPSMHWGLAIILLGTTSRLRWLFFMMVPISLGLMATALVQGAHYLADAIAGAMVGGLSIIIADGFLSLPAIATLERALSEAGGRTAKAGSVAMSSKGFGLLVSRTRQRLSA
ncbi:phosphatase PAP2 family protein [Methylobacterium sp. SD21]|uniref:phosphatase PAP2 family protein n=1 Tax=Methylobacterium litchii TaxID=3138810 RepID=UPI00313AEFD5